MKSKAIVGVNGKQDVVLMMMIMMVVVIAIVIIFTIFTKLIIVATE